MGKKILIAGVNSFLGEAIVKLLKNTHDVVGLYHKNSSNLDPDITNLPFDQLNSLNDEFDCVFFISAYIPKAGKADQQKLFDVNVNLLSVILNQFKRARFIIASSVSVYGLAMQGLSEVSPSVNANPYGLSKLWAEQLVSRHPSYASVRITSMYGPKMSATTFLPLIIKSAIEKKVITLYGDGERLQNYIQVNDVAQVFVSAALSDTNGIFLAADERSYSNAEVAAVIKNYLPDTNITFQLTDNTGSVTYNSDYTRHVLNWQNRIHINQGIQELIAWMKKEY